MYYTQQYVKNYDMRCLSATVIIYSENLLSTNNVSYALLVKLTTKQWQYQIQHQTVFVTKLCPQQKINMWSPTNNSHFLFCKCCNNQMLLIDTWHYMVHCLFCCGLHSWTDYLEGSICADLQVTGHDLSRSNFTELRCDKASQNLALR